MKVLIDQKQLVAAFNEWMRRYIEQPEEFGREWQEIQTFLAESAKGGAPSYGDDCAAYLVKLISEAL